MEIQKKEKIIFNNCHGASHLNVIYKVMMRILAMFRAYVEEIVGGGQHHFQKRNEVNVISLDTNFFGYKQAYETFSLVGIEEHVSFVKLIV